MEEVYKAIQQAVGPELNSMKQDVKKFWPEEDPELLLMQWLCERNGLKMPQKQTEQPPVVNKIEPSPPKSVPPSFRRPPGPNTSSDTSPGRLVRGSVLEPVLEKPLKVSPRQLLPSPKATLTSHQLLEDELNTDRDYSKLRTAVNTHEKAQDDARRFCVVQDTMKGSDEAVAGTIAKLRTELRGKFMTKIPLLNASVLTENDKYRLVGKLTPWLFEAGEMIMEQGAHGDKLYIIERGSCEIIIDGIVRDTIGREQFFGELAVIYAGPRTASVRAKTGVTLLSLSRGDLYNTIGEEKVAGLAVVARTRMFSQIPLLSALSPSQKELVTTRLKQETFPAGTVIARQGEIVQNSRRRLYICEDGHCRKEVNAGFSEENAGVEEIGRGGYFSMWSMYYGCAVGATVTAETEVTTLSISYDELMDICVQEHKQEARRLEREAARVARRLKKTTCANLGVKQKTRKFSANFMSNLSALEDLTSADFIDKSFTKQVSDSDLKRVERELCSETLKAIRAAMHNHMLCRVFVKVDRADIAQDTRSMELCGKHATEKEFARWDTIFSKGATVDMVYILTTGSLAETESDLTTLTDANEMEQETEFTVEHLTPGTFFNVDCMTTREPVTKSTLAATSQCTMMCVPGDVMRRILAKGGRFGEVSSRLSNLSIS